MTSVTEGPYYLDGALVRKDITEGKSGVPLTLRLTVVDATDGCTPVKGAAVEIWHCDAWGYYSGYTTANPGGSAPAESEEGDSADDRRHGDRQIDDCKVALTTGHGGELVSPGMCSIHTSTILATD